LHQRLLEYRFIPWVALSYLIAGGVAGFCYEVLVISYPHYSASIPYAAAGAIIGLTGYSFTILFIRLNIQQRLRWVDINLAKTGIEELSENIQEDFFTKLVQINFKYIDQYYLQTQEQAEKSFRLAVFASVSGLVILAFGIVMMYFNLDKEKELAGILTTSSGILSQFIAAVFFYLYNQTIIKMSQYHQKLVITQNISLALKITADMDKDEKAKSLTQLVDRLTSDVNKYLVSDHEPKKKR
jgi:hypothetical protein